MKNNVELAGGFKLFFPFHIWDVILPIDELLIFFKMVIAPPTRESTFRKDEEFASGHDA